ncbi:hypothetical protein BC567DRAFT_246990 [Phyllosticta citribraziliensis]
MLKLMASKPAGGQQLAGHGSAAALEEADRDSVAVQVVAAEEHSVDRGWVVVQGRAEVAEERSVDRGWVVVQGRAVVAEERSVDRGWVVVQGRAEVAEERSVDRGLVAVQEQAGAAEAPLVAAQGVVHDSEGAQEQEEAAVHFQEAILACHQAGEEGEQRPRAALEEEIRMSWAEAELAWAGRRQQAAAAVEASPVGAIALEAVALREEAALAEEIQVEVVRAEEIRAEEIQAEEIQAEEIQAEEILEEEIQAEEILEEEILVEEKIQGAAPEPQAARQEAA